jgi:HJR/Mrr/RecB family endonuclease
MHLKVTYVDFCFWSSGWLDGIIYLSFHFYVLWGFLLSKALRKKRNVEDEAVQKEIMKLRSEVSGLWFDCDEKEKSFKILEKDFIESRTKVQAMCEEKSKLGETMGRKISELKASNAEKDN